jgi:hypothetical protein
MMPVLISFRTLEIVKFRDGGEDGSVACIQKEVPGARMFAPGVQGLELVAGETLFRMVEKLRVLLGPNSRESPPEGIFSVG